MPRLRIPVILMLAVVEVLVIHALAAPAPADPLAAYSDLVLADGPLAYWKLDDLDATQMLDASGHGWTGAYSGGISPDGSGPVPNETGSMRFDGSSATASAPLRLSSMSAVTLEFWLSWDGFADNDRLAFELSDGSGTFQSSDGFMVNPNSGYWPGRFEVSMGDGSGDSYNSVLFDRPDPDNWHHYAIVLDRSAPPDRQIVPYVDGTPVSYTKPVDHAGRAAANHDRFADGVLSLMSRSGNALFGAGALDHVAAYPTALSAARIGEHFHMASGATPPVSTAAEQTLAMRAIPLSESEVPNPLRGEYQWYGESVNPDGWPYQDSYTRFYWTQLERAPGVYDFATIDAELVSAAARGGRFGFRVMSVCTGCGAGGNAMPAYLTTTTNGWYAVVDGERNFIPDWNNATYLSRWEALMHALGARYANDPRLGVIDIGGVGDWSEWHDAPYAHQYPGPRGQVPIGDANARRIVDSSLAAFPPDEHLLVIRTANSAAVRYALGRSPRVGLRLDCLGGDDGMAGDREALAAVAEVVTDRWQTAPIVSEWCATVGPGTDRFQRFGLPQVREFHVSMLSSGNFIKTNDNGITAYSPPEQDAFIAANKLAGYRFVLDGVTLSNDVPRGDNFTVTARWQNVNLAPTYLPFALIFRLQDGNGTVIWEAQSTFDLRHLLPTNGTAVSWTDRFSLAGVEPGEYQVSLLGLDPAQISPPLRLAIEGRQPNGSYPLGSVSVR